MQNKKISLSFFFLLSTITILFFSKFLKFSPFFLFSAFFPCDRQEEYAPPSDIVRFISFSFLPNRLWGRFEQISFNLPVFLFFLFIPSWRCWTARPMRYFSGPKTFFGKKKKPALPLKRDGEKSRIIPVRANFEKDAVVRLPPRFPSVPDQEAPARALLSADSTKMTQKFVPCRPERKRRFPLPRGNKSRADTARNARLSLLPSGSTRRKKAADTKTRRRDRLFRLSSHESSKETDLASSPVSQAPNARFPPPFAPFPLPLPFRSAILRKTSRKERHSARRLFPFPPLPRLPSRILTTLFPAVFSEKTTPGS